MHIHEIVEFWFGTPGSEKSRYQIRRKLWFQKKADTDQMIREKFFSIHQKAAAGQLNDWQSTPKGALALVIVFDQFSRNMFRGTPNAFATDANALAIANKAIAQGFDHQLLPEQRLFMYLPFEHSENLDDQEQSVRLFRQLVNQHPELIDTYEYAVRHKTVIETFGRFPHRNHILGRPSTSEEIEFLKEPGSTF